MPSLFRFIRILILISALIFGVMAALVYFVEPREREMTITIPARQLNVE